MEFNKYLMVILGFFLLTVLGYLYVQDVQNLEEPPEAVITIEGENIESAKGTYQWKTKGLFSNKFVLADAPAPTELAKDLKMKIVSPGSLASVEFSDGSKPQLKASLWEGNQSREELPINNSDISLPAKKGIYIVELYANWSNGYSSYTFVIDVQ